MSRNAVAIRHVSFEDLGLLEPLLSARGYSIEYIDAGVDDLSSARVARADLLIVLGGPIGVADLAKYPCLQQELDLLSRRLDFAHATLGICLGAQLIAAALGAAVRPSGDVEIGYAPITLTDVGGRSPLAGVSDGPVLHWHGDLLDLPASAENLASTAFTPHQAFRVGTSILGLQFHLEVDHRQIERWLIGHTHELASNNIDRIRIRHDAGTVGADLARRARQVFSTWLDGLDNEARPIS